MKDLFTVGHSSHSLEHFLSILKEYGITAVTDVRSAPYSRRNPQFNRENLAAELRGHGIAYVFLGRELGARSDDPSCYVEGQARYELIAKTTLFQEGLERVIRGVERYRVALMCAEADPLTCHRAVLVGRSLNQRGLELSHIHRDGSLEHQNEFQQRLLRLTGFAQGHLFSSRNALDQAYEKQGRKIAYAKPSSPTPPPSHLSGAEG